MEGGGFDQVPVHERTLRVRTEGRKDHRHQPAHRQFSRQPRESSVLLRTRRREDRVAGNHPLSVSFPRNGGRPMFAVYATHAATDDPLSALKVGERPDPDVPEGWVRVKVSHASLNRHDLITLRGMSGHPEGITYPIILGNDAAGTLEDGTPVVIYPVMGSDDWRDDETLDPKWHIRSEFIHGTFADFAVVPRRNAIRLRNNRSPLHASVLGTAWLTAYRALFTKSGLRAGETVLVQGATGGMATALIQLGQAAGFEVWATSRTEEGRAQARALGAQQAFASNEPLPRKVPAVVDNVGSDSWAHSISSLARVGTLLMRGGT